MSHTLKIVLAFAFLYLVWGGSFLAIHIGVSQTPPLVFAGTRLLIAGPLLLAFAAWRGESLPGPAAEWFTVLGSGALIVATAGGLLVWAQQWVASGEAALLIASSALWMAWIGTWGAAGERVSRTTLLGLLLGFIGVAVLVSEGLARSAAPAPAYLAVLAAALAIACGSVFMRRRPGRCGPVMLAGLQALLGGVVLGALGWLSDADHPWTWTREALTSLLFLTLLGSCIGYSLFCWLLREVTPAQLGTYAYVNPVVAVILGWLVLDERLTPLQWLGSAIVLGCVALVSLGTRARPVT